MALFIYYIILAFLIVFVLYWADEIRLLRKEIEDLRENNMSTYELMVKKLQEVKKNG